MKTQVRYVSADGAEWLTGVLLRKSTDGGALIRTPWGETVWRRAGMWRPMPAAGAA